jgi:glycosyltransferase involved in cell wall biosynthesis
MKICIVIDCLLPAYLYGGSERVVVWLARGLQELGHEVVFIAKKGSALDFADVYELDKTRPLDLQIPADTDIVHLHTDMDFPEKFKACMTIHGNTSTARSFHPNTIFCSHKHARNHGGDAFVHLGLDPREYGEPNYSRSTNAPLIFLGKAAWKLKNVKGSISVARRANKDINILGGTRLNFKMGFRFTFDTHAHFFGMVGGEEKNAILRNASGLVFPVLWDEPGATAVVESLYFGLPIFGTPYGCLPELVPSQAGLLSHVAEDLAEAASHSERFDPREINAWWSSGFTYRHMASKYLKYYESILDGQNLHDAPLISGPVRTKQLFNWID